MELEDLKRRWDLLSARLDREEIIRRRDTERMLRRRVGTYLRYVQFMLLLAVAGIPVFLAIGKIRGVNDAVLGWVVGGYTLCLLPSLYALRLLAGISRCEAGIVELERRMTRYAMFIRGNYLFQYVVVVLSLTGMLLWWRGYYTAHGMWWTVAAAVSVAAIAAVAVTWYDWERIRELRQRIDELREFDREQAHP